MIVDNMCKLVEDPAVVLPITPKFEPLVTAAIARLKSTSFHALVVTSSWLVLVHEQMLNVQNDEIFNCEIAVNFDSIPLPSRQGGGGQQVAVRFPVTVKGRLELSEAPPADLDLRIGP